MVNGEITDSALMGGHVTQLTVSATAANDSVHMAANGTVDQIDPAVVTGREQAKGQVGGTFDIDATLSNVSAGFDTDRLEATAKISVAPSDVAGLRIDRGNVDAHYRQQMLDVQSLDLSGPDLTVQASGTASLAPDGASHLNVHAASSNLEAIGKLTNQPIAGIGKVDATVTGNRTKLNIDGSATGDGVSFGSTNALALSTMYSTTIPNLSIRDAIVNAMTSGTFVTIGGQHINALTANTTYQGSTLDVDVTASMPQRSVSATGSLLLHPDHQEVHVSRLDLAAQNLQWHLAPGSCATIRYAPGAVTVTDVRLINGDQDISAEGSLGRPGDALNVTLKNVDLSAVDAVLLRPPQFSGRLNATSTITGQVDALQAKVEFDVQPGGFRQFRYDSLKGSADYSGKGVTVDAELQENPTASLRVKGYVPATAWGSGAASDLSGDENRFALRVDSTPIDLGIVQGFTKALTNVTGTAQANLEITGAGNDPRPNGEIVFTNGAFTVEPTGVPYRKLNGRIELQEDRIHIAQLVLLDNQNAALSVTGDVPIRRSETGDVDLYVTAREFKVLDNKMGNVRIDSDLTLTGELRALRLEGDLAVSSGTVNLDPIVASTGGGPYSTKPTEFLSAPSATDEQKVPTEMATPGLSNIAMNVHFTVPDDLVMKSSDLKPANAPIGFGAVNITVGSDIRATKDPKGPVVLTGTVNTVRGTYDFQGRQFTILRDGTVRFEGDPLDHLNPTLDVRTQRIIQGVQANANVEGTLERPRIELSSVPPLERADILALIVFNQPVNQLGEGEQISLGQRAEQLALGSIAGELSKSLGSLLNVSEFQLQAAPESGAVAQVTIGQQVGQNLFVKVEQGVGDVSTTNVVIEYELLKWLRLQTNFVQAAALQQALFQAVRDSGFDLIFMFTR
jgi:autotransporter translocation and assembly factor TamB